MPVHPRNSLNDLTGEEWLYFTKSHLSTHYPSILGHQLRKAHGANKPPQLMQELIQFFTKQGQRVLDPFAGVGGTLLGASLAQREAVGIELNPQWIKVYQQVCQAEQLPCQQVLQGDCRKLLTSLEPDSFDFVATDPPYNIQLPRTMCDGSYAEHKNRQSDYGMYSEQDGDLANLADYDSFLAAMREVFRLCHRVLKPKRYMVVIVRDAYQNGEYLFTGADLAREAKQAGFTPKGDKIWYQAGSRLRPYGYPFSYVPNITHQHILIVQKTVR